MTLTEPQYYNALNLLCGGDYSKLKKLRGESQNWENIWKGLGNKEKDSADPEKDWNELEKIGATLVLKDDPDFPAPLKNIPSPPFGIYFLGKLTYEKPAVAIVGTRAATPTGKKNSEIFAKKLAEAGIPIISGLAMGIDEFAHRGCLAAGGKTIAVLGTPLNKLYPKQNENLAKEILKNNGAIISEFPFNRKYTPSDFLVRNRIISGLANAILVIEAPEKSGALATAKFALDQNREIFVIPGGIENKNYIGSNALIKDGAFLASGPKDILMCFNLQMPAEIKINPAVDPTESSVIKILKKSPTECTIEKLLENTGLEINLLNQTLALLTIKGVIKELNGKYSLN